MVSMRSAVGWTALGLSLAFSLTADAQTGEPKPKYKWKIAIIGEAGEMRPSLKPTGGSFPLSGTSWTCTYGAPSMAMLGNERAEVLRVACSSGTVQASIQASCSPAGLSFGSVNLSEKGAAAYGIVVGCETVQ
jgi:hypothetical protein